MAGGPKKGDKVHVVPPHMLSGSEGKVTKTYRDIAEVKFDDLEDPVNIPKNLIVPLTED